MHSCQVLSPHIWRPSHDPKWRYSKNSTKWRTLCPICFWNWNYLYSTNLQFALYLKQFESNSGNFLWRKTYKNNTEYDESDDLIFSSPENELPCCLLPMYMLPRSKNKSYPSYKNKLLHYLQKIICQILKLASILKKLATRYNISIFSNIWNRPKIREKYKGLSHAELGNIKRGDELVTHTITWNIAITG